MFTIQGSVKSSVALVFSGLCQKSVAKIPIRIATSKFIKKIATIANDYIVKIQNKANIGGNLDACDDTALLKYYKEKVDKFSCQPFILHSPPKKKINLKNLLSEFKGDLDIKSIPTESYEIFEEFKSDGELLKKITVIDSCLINESSGLILVTHEIEHPVFFRNKKYLFIETKFVLLKIELIKESCFLYIFAKKDSIKALIDVLPQKLNFLGLQIGELSLSKPALSKLHEDLGGNLTQFSLINITPRLKSLRGSGTELQNDDTFKDLKNKPTTEIYRYLFEMQKPSSNPTYDKLTISIVTDCFIHSFHNITCLALHDFIRENVLPKATAKVVIQHSLSAYSDTDMHDDFVMDEEET